jgi:predicted transcriptional regulator
MVLRKEVQMKTDGQLSKDLKAYLKKTGLPLYQLAPIVGLSQVTLYKVIKGEDYRLSTERKIRKIIDRAA